MASVSLRDLLAAPQLCGLFQTLKPGIPDVFPEGFYATDQEVASYYGSYFQADGVRDLARISEYGSPSRAVQRKGLKEVPVVLYHVNENLPLPMHKFMSLIKPDSAGSDILIDEKGQMEITRHIKDARQRVSNLRIALLTQLLTLGNNYFDSTGQLLPTSSGAKTSSPSQITAANIGNVSSVIPGATPWTGSTADIVDQLVGLDQLATDNTGYDLGCAFYGRNIPKYMSGNPKLAAFLTRNAGANDLYIKKGRITELGNLSWYPGYRSSFRSETIANGVITETTNRIIGDNQIIFTPDPSPEWLGWIDGGYPIPRSIEVERDGLAALANVEIVHGDFVYFTITVDPLAIKMIFGTTTLPTVRVPSAVYTVDVSM